LAHPPHPHVRKKLEPEVPSGDQRAAVFDLNGSRVGELTVFLDRRVALDHAAGKPVEVPGARAQDSDRLD